MALRDEVVRRCPKGHALAGLGTFCWRCGKYVEPTTKAPEAAARLIRCLRADPTIEPDDRPEKLIQRDARADLIKLGFVVWWLSQARKSGQTPGIADLYLTAPRVCAWLEMKRKGGVQSDDQLAFQDAVTAGGGIYRVAYSAAEAVSWARSLLLSPPGPIFP